MTMQDELGVDQLDSLITILELIRSGRATTKPEIARTTGYGRALVAQRVMSLMSLGLVAAGDTHIEGRGRAPRTLHLSADSGVLLLTELGTSRTDVCVSDLDGRHLASWSESRDIHQSPESLLENLAVVFERLLDESSRTRLDVWGVGIGVPAPVEYATGRASGSAIMPNWEGFSAREFLSSRFGAPTWVDNDVNLMALGEFRLDRATTSSRRSTSRSAPESVAASSAREGCTGAPRVRPETSHISRWNKNRRCTANAGSAAVSRRSPAAWR